MKILSLFDGISVAQQALKCLGVNCEYYASEIDKYAISLTQKNFPDTIQLGSVVDLKPDFQPDLLIGGSPCQDLSIAKKNREGLSGSRSGLFYEYVRILKETKPRFFVLENVNSMPKEAKETITKELFGIEPVMINAALVSAQNRKRLFWVGKLDNGTYKQVEISQPEDSGILLKDILENGVDDKYVVKINEHYTEKTTGEEKTKRIGGFYNQSTRWGVYDKNGTSPTLTASMGTGGGHTPMIRIGQLNKGGQGDRIYSTDGKSVNSSANGGGRGAKTGLYLMNHKMADKKHHIEKSPTLLQSHYKEPLTVNSQNSIIRKLTPVECERLQSLPDNYTDGVSNSQRYKALGNAFNCEVVKHILKHLWK